VHADAHTPRPTFVTYLPNRIRGRASSDDHVYVIHPLKHLHLIRVHACARAREFLSRARRRGPVCKVREQSKGACLHVRAAACKHGGKRSRCAWG